MDRSAAQWETVTPGLSPELEEMVSTLLLQRAGLPGHSETRLGAATGRPKYLQLSEGKNAFLSLWQS